jgi:hypothetical protein
MELLWYYEDYLSFPYGASEDRAQKVRSMMCRRGEELFQSVFSLAAEVGEVIGYLRESVVSFFKDGSPYLKSRSWKIPLR